MPDPVSEVQEKVRALREGFDRDLAAAGDASSLQAIRDRYVGRKSGAVTGLMKGMGSLSPEGRRQAGQELNALKDHVEQGLERARLEMEGRDRREQLARDRVD